MRSWAWFRLSLRGSWCSCVHWTDVGMRIWPSVVHGARLSLLLVLVTSSVFEVRRRWYADTAYGHGFALPLCGPGARVFTARRWYADTAYGHGFLYLSVVLVLVCSVSWRFLSCSIFLVVDAPVQCCRALYRGDSTGTVLGSLDDVPVVVQRQVQGQTVQKACWYRSCVRGRFPSWRRGRFHGPNCSFDHGHSQLQYTMADVPVELVMQTA